MGEHCVVGLRVAVLTNTETYAVSIPAAGTTLAGHIKPGNMTLTQLIPVG